MADVVCKLCKYYVPLPDDGTEGTCLKQYRIKLAGDLVCEEFFIEGELDAKYSIPEFCKNYNKK